VPTSLIPLLPLLIVAATAIWVYADEQRHVAEGSPVVLRIGSFSIDNAPMWLAACVIVWIFFFPAYLIGRSRV
jgi:hypothetical protein